jgi:hypothetical protein
MNLDTPIQIEITPSMILAFFFIVVASWVRLRSIDAKKNWNKAWDATAPNLREGPPPMVGASRGITGCAQWVFGWIIFLVFIALFWDFLLFEGDATRYVGDHLGEWIDALGNGLLSLLRTLARAFL